MIGGQDDIDFGHAIESTQHHPTEAERNAMALQACQNMLHTLSRKLYILGKPRAARRCHFAIKEIEEKHGS